MESFKVNFRCPTLTVKIVDEMAAADHRDRTSMLNKMLDFYLSHHPIPTQNDSNNHSKKAVAKKKGVTR